ncbi:MAG TPA: hypothetical protein VGR02_22875 [Thermoanaerobaculia bacterium]|jgi:hypothetical protein|nr:hypothetical protein [Thermoanaerobaculia bacterium]
MQHVLVVYDEVKEKPVAYPFDVNLWRDDRLLMWELVTEQFEWSNEGPGGVDKAVLMDSAAWFTDGGTLPQPIGARDLDQPDRRVYAAMGPGPADELQVYVYDMYVRRIGDTTSEPIRVTKQLPPGAGPTIPVDPDISNQPHP